MSSISTARAALLQTLERELRTSSAQGVIFSQAMAERLGLNPTDLECLGILSDLGPLTAGQLAELTGLTTGAITGLVDRLEKRGYARRVSDPSDRRRVIVEPVAERVQAIDALFQPLKQATAELCARYSDEELALVLDFLTRCGALLQTETSRLRASGDPSSASAETAPPLGSATAGRLIFVGAASQIAVRADTSLPGVPVLAFRKSTPAPRLTLRVDPALPDLYRADYEGPPPNVYVRGGTVKVHYRRSPLDWRERAAEIVLNGRIPWRIEAHGGVGELLADLRDLRLDGLELSGGLARAELVLPRPAGTVRLRVSGGANSLVVHRPREVAVRVQVSGGTNELTLDEQHLRAAGGHVSVESADYRRAADRYELDVSGGVNTLLVDAF